MKKIFSIIIFSFVVNSINAIIVQKLNLKNGSVLSGFIQKQDSSGKLTFHSERAIICLNNKNVSISNERSYSIKDLDQSWITWAEENDAFNGIGDNRTLDLADVSTGTKSAYKVKIIERGIIVKYLETSSNTYQIEWKDVESIKGDRRSKLSLSGINRTYHLKSGTEYEGEFAEENDSILSLYLNNGIRQSFKINDVVKYTFRAINPHQTLFQQSELLDIINTKNGDIIKGIIIEQNYSNKKDTENYFLIQQLSGSIQSVKLSDITETLKEENPDYSPQYDILLNKDEVVINRQKAFVVNVKESNDEVLLDSIPQNMIIPKATNGGTKISLEYLNPGNPNVEFYQMVKVQTKKDKKNVKYFFTYRELVNASYRPTKIETSINNTTKVDYSIWGEGIFALYDSKKKHAIPFVIK